MTVRYHDWVILLSCVLVTMATHAEPDGGTEPADDHGAWERLESVLADRPQTGGLVGRFEQTRTSLLLAEPLVSSGRLAVVGGWARFDTEWPEPSITLVGPEAITLVDADGLAETYPRGNETDVLGALLAGETEGLRPRYTLTEDVAIPEQDGRAARFTLVEKAAAPGQDPPSPPEVVRLEMDAEGRPSLMQIDEGSGETLTLRVFGLTGDETLTLERLSQLDRPLDGDVEP